MTTTSTPANEAPRSLIPGRPGAAAALPVAPVVPLASSPPPPPPAPAPAVPAGAVGTPAPLNRFLVQPEGKQVRIRGLPIGRMSATEARALCAWVLLVAEEVATPTDSEFQDLYTALLKQRDVTAVK